RVITFGIEVRCREEAPKPQAAVGAAVRATVAALLFATTCLRFFSTEMTGTVVPARKDVPEKQKESRERPRFTADEIVCAIEAVEKTGLIIPFVFLCCTISKR